MAHIPGMVTDGAEQQQRWPGTDGEPGTGPASESDNGSGPGLDHVSIWLFDLDNTLYPASCNLFAQIDRRMGEFICRFLGLELTEAKTLQKRYFREHGTTMRGLMDNHGLDPKGFLDYVHEIDHSPVPASPALDRALAALPGRKMIYTNGSAAHAEKVMARLGVGDRFDGVFDIVDAEYRPKPDPESYRRLATHFDFDPRAAIFVDDIPKNLEPAAALGMTTCWLRTETEYAKHGNSGPHIHHVADDLVVWLEGVAAARAAQND